MSRLFLIHSCCAPCSSYVLEYLSRYFRITVLYYNPNIYPESEYTKADHRAAETDKRYAVSISGLIPCWGKYDKEKFYEMAKRDGAFERRRRTMHEML